MIADEKIQQLLESFTVTDENTRVMFNPDESYMPDVVIEQKVYERGKYKYCAAVEIYYNKKLNALNNDVYDSKVTKLRIGLAQNDFKELFRVTCKYKYEYGQTCRADIEAYPKITNKYRLFDYIDDFNNKKVLPLVERKISDNIEKENQRQEKIDKYHEDRLLRLYRDIAAR